MAVGGAVFDCVMALKMKNVETDTSDGSQRVVRKSEEIPNSCLRVIARCNTTVNSLQPRTFQLVPSGG